MTVLKSATVFATAWKNQTISPDFICINCTSKTVKENFHLCFFADLSKPFVQFTSDFLHKNAFFFCAICSIILLFAWHNKSAVTSQNNTFSLQILKKLNIFQLFCNKGFSKQNFSVIIPWNEFNCYFILIYKI